MFQIGFDSSPILFIVLSFVLFFFILTWAYFIFTKKEPISSFTSGLFVLINSLFLIFNRLPILLFNKEIDVDESQNISHAITLKSHPIYWQSVDGTTIGPLDHYVLTLANLLGLAFDYTSARIVGLFLLLVSLWFFYISIVNFFNRKTALIASLFLFSFFSFTQNSGFVHYTSELLPIALWMSGVGLFSSVYNRHKYAPVKLFTIGLVSGMAPFAKLQIVPMIFVLIVVVFIWIFWINKAASILKTKSILFLFLGICIFPLLVLVHCLYFGLTDEFMDFYIKGNLLYAKGLPFVENIKRIPFYFSKSIEFMFLLGFALLFCVISIFKKKKSNNWLIPLWVFFTLVFSFYAILKSGNDFIHYLLLVIFPLGYILAKTIQNFVLDKKNIFLLLTLLLIMSLSTVFFRKIKSGNFNLYASSLAENRALPSSAVSKKINELSTSTDDQLVVWGWACQYYIETQMPHATAMNHTERCIFGSDMKEVYRKKFFDDLQKNKPAFFVDAVGKNSMWLNNKTTQGYQSWPLLAEYISKKYTLIATLDDVLIFARKESIKK